MKKSNNIFPYVLLPILFSLLPALIVYNANIKLVVITSLLRILGINVVLSVVLFFLFYLFLGKNGVAASFAAVLLLTFYNSYGFLLEKIRSLDLYYVGHNNLIPTLLLLSVSIAFLIKLMNRDVLAQFFIVLIVVVGFLFLFNLGKIIPAEISKSRSFSDGQNVVSITEQSAPNKYPDIYFLIFDEFSSFKAMRDFWHYQEIDTFVDFLKEKGFRVLEASQVNSIDTLHLLTERLNYRYYPLEADQLETYYHDIANSEALRYAKSQGYTTIVFDETRVNFAYPTKPVVVADEYYDQPEGDVTKINTDGGVFDEFGVLVFDKTMLRVFSKYYKTTNPALENHINMISFVTEKLGRVNRDEPVFVYSHLMLPHMPFMFDKNGNLNIALYHQNWDYYLGHYQFTISVIEELITNILSQYGPDDQPVIILQSDHGARNKKTTNPESKDLADYPEEYKTLIMNALFIPQCEPNQFKEDMNPVNTFPLIYNCLFGDSIPMVESGSVP